MSMSTTPTTARPLLQAVRAQFATRPTLRAVVAQLLEVLIAEQATPFNTAIESVYVAFPNNIGGYDVALLTDVVLDYLASGDVPDFGNNGSDRQAHLVDATKRRVFHTLLGETRWPDMLGLESLIRELPGILHIGFQETLSNYWNAPGTTGASRWQWLGDQLRDSLRSTALGADASIRQTLTQVVDYPDRLRLPLATGIHIYTLETGISQGPLAVNLLSPALLIACNRRVLHCRVSGEVRVYASMDDFALAWQQEMTRQFDADAIRLKRFEPDDNVFDTQAALLLNQQLEDLAAITLPARTSRIELEQLYAQVSDPAHGFLDAPTATLQSLQRVQTALPQWLRSAPVVDQLAYRKHSLELATVRQASKGKSWSDGIDSLRAFAAKKLHQQMLLDQPQAPGYKPDELELTFYVPVGGNTDIHTLSQKMTLTDLALSNLSGKPNGRMTIRHTGGQLIQDWTTPDYLEGLISRVDIGKTYPLWLKERLLTASHDALERQRLFGNELKVMLPLNALELAIKGECGFTRIGYQFIAALVQPTRVTQMLGEDEIVIRPLAFRRKADAEPDGVDNMFVIERADQRNGPHLLYRPLYAQSLHQFPNRDALLAAIAAPGEIQESVLAWLSDRARPIYAHGGFREPHIVHFSALDPFGQPDPPKPATLATDASADELLQSLHNGKLMQNLFGRNARTLVDLADRESVSNTESRWARLLNGGWLLFNTLLGLPLSSPVLLVGWMVSLASSLVQDIPALGSQDATTRELGLVDLLLNIALVLLHGTPSAEPAVEATAADRSGLALDPLRRVAETLYAHVDIRSREGFTAQERISIYEHVIQMYSHQGYATEALQELGSRLLREQYWRPFLESLDEAIALAEWEMATAVHEIENTRVARPKAKPLQRKPTNKRVFKTRNNGVLIGNVRSQKSATGEALIDVVDPETGAVISTFHEHPEEGVFVQVVDAPPPARPPVAPSVKAAIMAANKLKQERVRREGVIRREVRQLDDPVLREEKHPEDWNTLLEQLATELEALIGELSSQSPVTEAASIAMEEWRAEVADLRATGKRYRDNGYKKQSPSAAKVLTLWRDKQLDFFLTKDRIPTDANDYLTEFAIKEKGLSHVLWYAHFHYARKTDADLAYVAGHLKRADQRNIGFKAQLQQASSNKEVARIWRSKISPEMAKKLFFVPT